MMNTVTVSPKYQIVIPKAIRDRMKIRPGEKLMMFEEDGVIRVIRIQDIQKLRGMFRKLTTDGLRDHGERI